ncbi:HlyD family secretion protein [Ancylobacter pratisalsi]|uniref:HlyD family efflux transporter periplasmic adaptor subunit n=1 Tax=Ancylobacter pratisalsi TaxID=1745854 RepID=A0A6P1YPZ1_9HYPH|nr:HlyD family efflux transporter periplasmic adaptor subunit [Ancylobacter pratisalsi]QIB35537.1 HlyD family efflux transporter periplasmic adaptor subunit [Ancylobacter pratisalsi]
MRRIRSKGGLGALLLALALAACADKGPPRYQGYAESELIFVGPDESGRVTRLDVDEGDRVQKGQMLFQIDPVLQQSEVDSAVANLDEAKAQLADLKASAQRPEEIAVLEASQRRAQAALELSRIELGRQQDLYAKKVGSKAALDSAQASFDQNQAALDEISKQMDVGRLASRDERVTAAEKAVLVAQANLDAATTRLERRKLTAPSDGSVETVYFRPGELVPVGRPVLSLLPPELIKMRFFVPEPDLNRFKLGTKVQVSCDGCGEGVAATVSYIAEEAEYTPPVIYSLDERAKLVFMLEARPEDPLKLRPGQPITVEIAQ